MSEQRDPAEDDPAQRRRPDWDDDDWVGEPPEGHYSRDRADPGFWTGRKLLETAAVGIGLALIVLVLVLLLA